MAFGQGADLAFHVPRIGRIDREAGERLLQGQRLFRAPPARGLVVAVLPGDSCVQAPERVHGLDREVGAERDAGAALLQRPPGVGAQQPVCAHAGFGHRLVGRGVGGLHRGDDLQLGEARDVGGVDQLGVLDPVAEAVAISGADFGEAVERLAVGGVADGVDGHLVAEEIGAAEQVLLLGVVDEAETPGAGFVAVGLEEPGAAAAECAVGVELDAPEREALVVEPWGGPERGDRLHRVHAAGVGGDADRQATGVAEAAEQRPVLGCGAHVVDAGEAEGGHVVERGFESLFALAGGRGRRGLVDEGHGGIDEDAGGVAGGIAEDAAAGRVLGGPGDSGRFHGCAVGPACVAVDALEPDRAFGVGGIEIGSRREAAEGPDHLVPAPAADPARGGLLCGVGGDAGLGIGKAGGGGEVELAQADGKAHHMAVRVDEAREQRAALRIQLVVAGGEPGLGGAAREDGEHLAVVADEEGVEAAEIAFGIQGIAVRVDDQRLRVGLRAGQQRCGEQRGEQAAHQPSLRMRDEVSCRAPPIFMRSA